MKAERGICSSCQRDIAVDEDGNIWPHGGKPGSGFRCNGVGKPPQSNLLIDLLGFQPGDRVIRNGTTHGVVMASRDGETFVHWGSSTIRNSKGETVENRFEDWVPNLELVLCPDPVFAHGEKGTNETVTVWAGTSN